MKRIQPRRGYTLIELLVVVSLLVVLMTLAAMVIPALRANNDSVKAATQVTAALSIAKQQALRDQAPRGIRLIPDSSNPSIARSFQYVELPPAVIPTPNVVNGIAVPMILSVNRGVSANMYTATLAGARNNSNWIMYGIEIGDFLILNEGGLSYVGLITGFANSAPSTPNDTLLIYAISRNFPPMAPLPPVVKMDGFKVLRKPRPLVGEDVVQLPKEMVIDLTHSALASTGATHPSPWPWSGIPNPLTPEYDILFLPSGELSGSPHGVITLLVRAEDNPSDLPKMTLIAVYTRTGQIIMHPVAAGSNPYAFLQDGQGSGL